MFKKIFAILNNRSSIAARLTKYFLLIAVIPCIILLGLTLHFSRQSLEASTRQRLTLICDMKAAQLEEYIGERRADAVFLSVAPGFVEAIVHLNELAHAGKRNTEDYTRAIQKYRTRLGDYVESASFENLTLFDVEGTPMISYRPRYDFGASIFTGSFADSELASGFIRTRALLQPILTNIQIYPGQKDPASFVVGPMFREGVLVGILALELKNAQVWKSYNTYFGLGETGDTTAAVSLGDELLFVSATRFDPNSAFNDRIRFGDSRGQDIQAAVHGNRSYGEMADHLGNPVVTAWTYLPSYRWGITIKQRSSEAFDLLDRQRKGAIIFMILATLVVYFVARAVARTISRPIREAAMVAARVASGDLTARVTSSASGEAGQLLEALDQMTQDLRSLIGKIQQSSITLMSTATEISATSRQQGEAVSDYGASTSEAAAAVKQISATSLELLRTMNEVNTVATQTRDLASDGQDNLVGMGRSMRQLADSTSSIGSKLSVISERAGHINLAVTMIAKVADQTNLLSINAAIEAEKAGEYGLGFLVVAREIRRLADQTAVATLDIERMVKEMQYSVSAGVMEMDKFSDQVRRGVDEVAAIGDQLGGIIGAVQGLTGRFDQVNEGMRVQSQGADQIREAVIRLSEGAHQTSISLHEFNRATDHLRDAVGGLKEEVSRFTVDYLPLTPPAH